MKMDIDTEFVMSKYVDKESLYSAMKSEITELREEVARLKKANRLLAPEKQLERITNKCRQLASAELHIKQMREALLFYAYGKSSNSGLDVAKVAQEAVSTPTTTEHLDDYVREVVDRATDKLTLGHFVEKAIRARKGRNDSTST